MYSLCLALSFLMFGNLALAQSPDYSSGADAPTDYQQTPPDENAALSGESSKSGTFFDRVFSNKDNGKAPSKAGIFARKAGNAVMGLAFNNPVKKMTPKTSLAKAKQMKEVSLIELILIILLVLIILSVLRYGVAFELIELLVSLLVLILLVLLILWLLGKL